MASPWRPLLVSLKKRKSNRADGDGVAIVGGLASESRLPSDRCLLLRCHPNPRMAGREEVLSSGPISCRAVAKQVSGVKTGDVSERRVPPAPVVPCRLHTGWRGQPWAPIPFLAVWARRTTWLNAARWDAIPVPRRRDERKSCPHVQ